MMFLPFSLFINLYFLIPAIIAHIFTPIAELVIPIEIPTKEAKAETEKQPVIVEITVSVQYNSKLHKFLCFFLNFYLQLKNFLFYLFFQSKFLTDDFIFSDALLHYQLKQ